MSNRPVLEKRTKPVRILSTSDWHLGNPRVPAYLICNRLRKTLFPVLQETDLLNIGGDVWDTLLSFSEETNIITAFIIDLLRWCDRHSVVVRILLGTFTHDRTQSTIFEIYHEKCKFSNDLKYVNTVSLEEIASLGLRILYLPDDLPYEDSDTCVDVVKGLMSDRGWNYVDYVFGHGYFDHMLPDYIPKKPKCTYRIEQFLPIVRRYVCMGHVHTNDHTGPVIYNNSFDRLVHGEEEPKGCIYIEDHGDTAKIKYVVNKESTKFYTIDLSKYTDTETVGQHYLDILKKKFSPKERGHVRVIHPSAEIRQSLQRLTTSNYSELVYTFKKLVVDTTDTHRSHRKLSDVVEYPTPTPETLPTMIYDFLVLNGGTSLTKDRIENLLSEK